MLASYAIYLGTQLKILVLSVEFNQAFDAL